MTHNNGKEFKQATNVFFSIEKNLLKIIEKNLL